MDDNFGRILLFLLNCPANFKTIPPGQVRVKPAAAGLGSSAALSVAVTRLFARTLAPDRSQGGQPGDGPVLSDDEVQQLANSAERCFHDNPSGVDVALATRGGIGVFVRGRGLRPLAAEPLPLAVGLSGQARRTAVGFSDAESRARAQRAGAAR